MFAGIIMRPLGNLIADELRRQLLHLRHVGHLFGDQALARKVHLAHVAVAGPRSLFAALDDPLGARRRDLVIVACAIPIRLVSVAVCMMPIAIGEVTIPVFTHAALVITIESCLHLVRCIRRVYAA